MRNTAFTSLTLLAVLAGSASAQDSARARGAVRAGPPAVGSMGRTIISVDTSRDGVRAARFYMDTTFVVSANRAVIGISISLASGTNDATGALVQTVVPNGPADKAGVKTGDIITKVNDVTIATTSSSSAAAGLSIAGQKLMSTLADLKPGVPATLQVKRGKDNLTLKVTPDRDESRYSATMVGPVGEGAMNGFTGKVFMNGDAADSFFVGGRMGSLGLLNDMQRKLNPEFIKSLPEIGLGDLMARSPDSARRVMSGSMVIRTSFDALSRLELAPINPELGAYFGASEGVLVVSIAPPGVIVLGSGNIARMTTEPTAPRAYDPKVSGQASASASPAPKAAVVAKDGSSSNADVLNLRPGDVITSVDSRKVNTPADLMRILRSYNRNDEVKMTVLRQKKVINISTKMPAP